MTTSPMQDPIVEAVHVPLGPDRAFELFTAHVGEWWPLDTHSVGREDAVTVVFPRGVGGQIVEHLADGTECVWGTVLDWDPPHRVRCTWHPGNPEAAATEVEVRFEARDDGTHVELRHSGWGRRPDGEAVRGRYEAGWVLVVGRYAQLAATDRGRDAVTASPEETAG